MIKTAAIQRLGRYHIHAEIARGGMAIVYRGELVGAAGFRREVAVKRILPQWTHEPEFVRMLIDEAKVLVGLHHHNIVQVFELGEEEGNFYIVMEYVRGYDLKRVLNRFKQHRESLPIPAVLQIVRQVCEALICAHEYRDERGVQSPIVHRDVSPQNILIRHDGVVKLTDFGIAKMLGKSSTTRAGTLKGKFSYMSPEQAIGTEVDPRTDVFALGLVLYEMLVGRKCFEGENDFEILEKIKSHDIQFPSSLDLDLQQLLQRCLKKNISERYENLRDTLRDLNLCLAKRGLVSSQHEIAEIMKLFFSDVDSCLQPRQNSADTQMITVNPHINLTEILDQTRVEDVTQMDDPENRIVKDVALIDSQNLDQNAMAVSWGGLCTALSLVLILINFLSPPIQGNVVNFTKNSRFLIESQTAQSQIKRDLLNAKHADKITTSFGLEKIKLKFKSEPMDAKITLSSNGIQKQILPDQMYRLMLGSQNMRLVATIEKEGYKTLTKSINLNRGDVVNEFKIELEELGYGAVSVQARPWGVAKITDVTESKTVPALFERLPEGQKTVSVFYPPLKKSVSRKVQVADGATVNCRASFGINKQFLSCW